MPGSTSKSAPPVTLEPDILSTDNSADSANNTGTEQTQDSSTSIVDGLIVTSENEGTTSPQELAADKKLIIIEEPDLLTRIRRGFRFPPLNAAEISRYEQWSSEHPTYLRNLFTRAEPFLHHIVEEIEKRGLPMELALLPAIESAYKPNAVSRSKAEGLWQFIPSTGKAYKLHQNWWYDGRRDLLASTDAALTYLTELNKRFEGDWFLTLAAYNAGQGTVSRAITANKRKHRPTGYQDIKLRTETRRYVPKLIALKNIIANPERYGVSLPNMTDRAHFARVKLPAGTQIDLKQFAHKSGIELDQLRHLNAGFLRWATPPSGPNQILVPLSHFGRAHQSIDELAKLPALNLHHHKIQQGETLSQIARKYSVDLAALKTSNRLKNNKIRAGRSLVIPIAGQAVARQSKQTTKKDNKNKVVHRVQRGETLWSIARRYQVQVKQLLAWNQIRPDQILSLNQALKVFSH